MAAFSQRAGHGDPDCSYASAQGEIGSVYVIADGYVQPLLKDLQQWGP